MTRKRTTTTSSKSSNTSLGPLLLFAAGLGVGTAGGFAVGQYFPVDPPAVVHSGSTRPNARVSLGARLPDDALVSATDEHTAAPAVAAAPEPAAVPAAPAEPAAPALAAPTTSEPRVIARAVPTTAPAAAPAAPAPVAPARATTAPPAVAAPVAPPVVAPVAPTEPEPMLAATADVAAPSGEGARTIQRRRPAGTESHSSVIATYSEWDDADAAISALQSSGLRATIIAERDGAVVSYNVQLATAGSATEHDANLARARTVLAR